MYSRKKDCSIAAAGHLCLLNKTIHERNGDCMKSIELIVLLKAARKELAQADPKTCEQNYWLIVVASPTLQSP